MEKRTPHSKLALIKAMIEAGKVRMTASAVAGAELLGFDRAGMLSVVMALTPADFYKSMTTHRIIRSGRTSTALDASRGRVSEADGDR